jgi:hypothetical protein
VIYLFRKRREQEQSEKVSLVLDVERAHVPHYKFVLVGGQFVAVIYDKHISMDYGTFEKHLLNQRRQVSRKSRQTVRTAIEV